MATTPLEEPILQQRTFALRTEVRSGISQLQKSIGVYAAAYEVPGVTDTYIELAPNTTFVCDSTVTVLHLFTSAPITVTENVVDGKVIAVRRTLVIDDELGGFTLLNSGTTTARVNVAYATEPEPVEE